MMKLFSKNSNLCDHNSTTLQTDRQTDRQTTCDRNTALCTTVQRAVKSRSWIKAPKSSHYHTHPATLRSRHWLKINECIEYNFLPLSYKILTTSQLTYTSWSLFNIGAGPMGHVPPLLRMAGHGGTVSRTAQEAKKSLG